jgi:hypothetical protein
MDIIGPVGNYSGRVNECEDMPLVAADYQHLAPSTCLQTLAAQPPQPTHNFFLENKKHFPNKPPNMNKTHSSQKDRVIVVTMIISGH